jgi:hypothetical protein
MPWRLVHFGPETSDVLCFNLRYWSMLAFSHCVLLVRALWSGLPRRLERFGGPLFPYCTTEDV